MKVMGNKSDKVKVIQIRSSSGCTKKVQLATLKGLGLGRIGQCSILTNNDCTKGMIRRVMHLVRVEEGC